jgi:hypothetical protein
MNLKRYQKEKFLLAGFGGTDEDMRDCMHACETSVFHLHRGISIV